MTAYHCVAAVLRQMSADIMSFSRNMFHIMISAISVLLLAKRHRGTVV